MPHGQPDWELSAGQKTTYRWADLDELAARLGSPVSYDRRGDMMFSDSFEDGTQKWSLAYGGAGAYCGLSRRSARSGTYSLRMQPGNLAGGGDANAFRPFPYPVLSAFGLELSFTLHNNLANQELDLWVYTGALVYLMQARLLMAGPAVQIYIPPANWQTVLVPSSTIVSAYAYHTLKMVADPVSGKYVRVLFDGLAANLAPYTIPTAVSVVNAQLIANFRATSINVNVATIYADDVILTQNEPT
jgi:hypothetical protein